MNKKILITGITGFVGSHLAEYCLNQCDKVYGTVLHHHLGDEKRNIKDIEKNISLYDCDLTNKSRVFSVIKEVKPDIIFHLAAHSFVHHSFHDPEEVLNNNINAELNILETVKDLKLFDTVIHIAGSSEEYGFVKPEECPITEAQPLRPMSPYAVSKITQEFLAKQYHKTYDLKTVITRAFNHEGPRRGIDFVTSAFASQIANLENDFPNKAPIVKVGNLEAERDFTDVRDVVRAYYLAVTHSCIKYGEEYNICSGKIYSIQQVLNILLAITESDFTIVEDEERMRPSDVPLLWGDCSKFKEVTGWTPEISFNKTLEDTLNYWREFYKK